MPNYMLSTNFKGGDTDNIKKLMREAATQWDCHFITFERSVAGHTFCAQFVTFDPDQPKYVLWSIMTIVNALIPKSELPSFYADKVFELVEK